MAETLGTLCDKLTIVKLKQYHTNDVQRLESLNKQQIRLQQEIDDFVADARSGIIPHEKLIFAANKVYKKEGNEVCQAEGSLGNIMALLSEINCKLWHVQEKVYEFDQIAADKKDTVIKELAVLNLERNNCIDEIDKAFAATVAKL